MLCEPKGLFGELQMDNGRGSFFPAGFQDKGIVWIKR